jgi:hypothetical protein
MPPTIAPTRSPQGPVPRRRNRCRLGAVRITSTPDVPPSEPLRARARPGVSSPARSVSWTRLASSPSPRAATNSMRTAALSTTFEPALLKRVKTSRSAAASVGPREIVLGRRYRRTRRAAALRRLVRPQRTITGKESTHSFHSQCTAHPGASRKPPLRATLAPHFCAEVHEYGRTCGGGSRRRSDRADVGG